MVVRDGHSAGEHWVLGAHQRKGVHMLLAEIKVKFSSERSVAHLHMKKKDSNLRGKNDLLHISALMNQLLHMLQVLARMKL